ncbi:MAG: lytic transglycosylase domain-containing protein [Bacteroidales bacterium]|nr:lytic transglycosylase domain-containing protein [Bacteroidales bacterium]
MIRKETICLIAATVLIAGAALASRFAHRSEPRVKPEHIRGVLELAPLADTSRALIIGYHYYLLKRFAADNDQVIDITLTERNSTYLDSLRAGVVDIVVVPWGDSLAVDSVLISVPVDSMSVWLMRHDEHAGMHELNEWIDAWHASAEYAPTREIFLRRFNPYRSRPRAQISPYDSLIRLHADSVGLDWHLLAAVMFQESRFHIEARSSRGALGLMQMMPKTAEKYGVTDPLDPDMSIRAGAQSLAALIKRYYSVTQDKTERYKYALAGYNAGVGRIDDCINLARQLSVDTSAWDSIVNQVLPQMGNKSVLDTSVVKLGPFRGTETCVYVERTMEVFNHLYRICP